MCDQSIGDAIAALGYERVRPRLFRARWSSAEIAHLFSYRYWSSGDALACSFGFYNPEAEKFARACVKRYGGLPYKNMSHITPHIMMFSFGNLAGWEPQGSLWCPLSDEQVVGAINVGFETKLLPLIRDANSCAALVDILRSDAEPFRWMYANGAMRAAYICYFARKAQMESEKIRSILEEYKKELRNPLQDGVPIEEYIDKIIEESKKFDPYSN